MKKRCVVCEKPFRGRSDKKYCSDDCKNKWHNTNRKKRRMETAFVDSILHQNHAILKRFLSPSEKKKKIRRMSLLQAGFQFDHCTGIYITQKGAMYLKLYEFAWLEIGPETVLVVRKS